MKNVYHIRKRAPRKRGNSFYRDKTVYAVPTLCGADETTFDIAWRDKAVPFGGRVPCSDCVRKRRNEKARANRKAREQVMQDAGLRKVRGNLGGTYYE